MHRFRASFCPWTTLFTRADCSVLLNISKSMFDSFMALDGSNFSGRTTCFAGRDIEMANAFDLLEMNIFFLIEVEFPEPTARLTVSCASADVFASLVDGLECDVGIPPIEDLTAELNLDQKINSFFFSAKIEILAASMIDLWCKIDNFCKSNLAKFRLETNKHNFLEIGFGHPDKAKPLVPPKSPHCVRQHPSAVQRTVPSFYVHIENDGTTTVNDLIAKRRPAAGPLEVPASGIHEKEYKRNSWKSENHHREMMTALSSKADSAQ